MTVPTWNRRDLLRMMLPLTCGFAAKAAVGTKHSISYRADAVILLLGIPVYRRAGVGGGFAEAAPGADGNSHTLRFAGYSRPEQARGLDRSGYLEENFQEEKGGTLAARYFGLMTSSNEETAEQARHALAANATELSFAAIQGTSLPGSRVSSTAVFGYPRETGEKNWRNLLAMARRSLAGTAPKRSMSSLPEAGYAAPTFLFCVRRAMASPTGVLRQRFVYGDREMFLDTEKAAEAGGAVFRLTGKVRKRERDSPAIFRIWFEQNSSLPFRIDYQPRSFLKLSFVRADGDSNLQTRFTEP